MRRCVLQTYETLFITPPDLTEDDERATVETLAKIVTEGGGTFHANERMGRRRLGYPIRKFDDGVYVRFLYDSESSVPLELDRRIRLTDKVLRSLTVRLEEDWAEASKKQAVVDAERRVVEAEARAKAEAEAAAAAAAEAPAEQAAPATPATAAEASPATEPGTSSESDWLAEPEKSAEPDKSATDEGASESADDSDTAGDSGTKE